MDKENLTSVEGYLISLLAEITGYDVSKIKLESKVKDELSLDSSMLLELQNKLQLSYEDLDIKELLSKLIHKDPTVGDIISEIKGNENVECYRNPSINNLVEFPEIVSFNKYYQHMTSIMGDPYFRVNEGIATNHLTSSDGVKRVNFSTYNYLGLNGDERINSAVKVAIDRYGTSVSGSRLIGGEIEPHALLEEKIASFLGVESAIVQVGGHSTNVNTIGNFVGKDDLILHDSLAHNSIIQGAILSGAKRRFFKHNDMLHLESRLKKLRSKYRRVLIVVEGVYSMDGDICDLPELIRLKEEYGAILMVDEAHSIGTIGENGRGVTSYYGIQSDKIDILMGTLSKALNSCGGYIAGKRDFINYLKYNSPGFVFSVGISPSNTMAAYMSLKLCDESPMLFDKLHENSAYLLSRLNDMGFDTLTSKNTPIIPLLVGESSKAISLSFELYKKGVYVMPIVYPAVKETEARLRFFVSASHEKEDIDFTVNALKECNNLLEQRLGTKEKEMTFL